MGGNVEMISTTTALALAKKGGSKAAIIAYKKLHPNDWQRRLAKDVKKYIGKSISVRHLRNWLKLGATAPLLENAVIADAGGRIDPSVLTDLGAALSRGRRWRRLSDAEAYTLTLKVLDRLLNRMMVAYDPSMATHLASQKSDEQFKNLGGEIGSVKSSLQDIRDGQASLTTAHQLDALRARLEKLPAASRTIISTSLFPRDQKTVYAIADSLSSPHVNPRATLEDWAKHEPDWVKSANHIAFATLGVLSEEYLLHEQAIDWYEKAARSGSPRRQYWLARAGWEAFDLDSPEIAWKERVRRISMEIGSAGSSPEPLARALDAALNENYELGISELEGWCPDNENDKSRQVRALASLILSSTDDFDRSSKKILTLISDTLSSCDIPMLELVRARLLIGRVADGHSVVRSSDLAAADAAAIKCRDSFRVAKQPSSIPVIAALDSAMQGGDYARVLRLGTSSAEFEGEAIPEEENNARVSLAVAMALTAAGKDDQARNVAERMEPGFPRAAAIAFCASSSATADSEQAQELWMSALREAKTQEDRVEAWKGLAMIGATSLPGLREELEGVAPQVVIQLEATAAQASGNPRAALALLLPRRHEAAVAARVIADAYMSLHEPRNAANTLLEAADDFNHPDLGLMAARILFDEVDPDQADEVAANLLSRQPSTWGGRVSALLLRAEHAANKGDDASAQQLLSAALQLGPANVSARWGLITVLVKRGRSEEAWELIGSSPEKLMPRNEQDARAWLQACLYGGPAGEVFALGALDIADQFEDNERLVGTILINLIALDAEVSDEIGQRIQSTMERFFERWPGSPIIRRISLPSNPENIIETLSQNLVLNVDRVRIMQELLDKISASTIPLALATEVSGDPYSLLVVNRKFGPLVSFAGDSALFEREVAVALDTLDGDVAIDLPACHVAAELGQVSEVLHATFRTGFRQVYIPDACVRDAVDGERMSKLQGVGTWVPGTEPQEDGHFEQLDGGWMDEIRVRATRLREFTGTLRAASVGVDDEQLAQFKKILPDSFRSVLALARKRKLTAWSDDFTFRCMAHEREIRSFSTLALLEALRRQNRIDGPAQQAACVKVVNLLIADLPLSEEVIIRAAAENLWNPYPAALAISRPQAWVDFEKGFKVWVGLLRQLVFKPDSSAKVPQWLFFAVHGAVRVPYEFGGTAVTHVAANLFGATLQIVEDPAIISGCVQSLEKAMAGIDVDFADPLPLTVRSMRDLLMRILPAESVHPYIIGKFSETDNKTRSIVAEALLR